MLSLISSDIYDSRSLHTVIKFKEHQPSRFHTDHRWLNAQYLPAGRVCWYSVCKNGRFKPEGMPDVPGSSFGAKQLPASSRLALSTYFPLSSRLFEKGSPQVQAQGAIVEALLLQSWANSFWEQAMITLLKNDNSPCLLCQLCDLKKQCWSFLICLP